MHSPWSVNVLELGLELGLRLGTAKAVETEGIDGGHLVGQA